MATYTITLTDTPEDDSVAVSLASDGILMTDEDSKAFQLAAFVIDAIQSLEGQEDGTIH